MSDVITNVRVSKSTDTVPANGWASGTFSGGIDWTTPLLGVYPDGRTASATLASGISTNYLIANNFHFAKRIPDTATVTGIEVYVTKSGEAGLRDAGVSVSLDSVIDTTINKADTTNAWTTTDTYGSSSDLWGQTITPDDINDGSTLGIAFAAKNTNASGDARVYLDGFTAKVYYTFGQREGNAVVGVNKFGNFQSLPPRINKTTDISVVETKYTNRFNEES